MMTVWILILYMGGSNSGGPAVIDNIASRAECERVKAVINTRYSSQCIEVWKVKP